MRQKMIKNKKDYTSDLSEALINSLEKSENKSCEKLIDKEKYKMICEFIGKPLQENLQMISTSKTNYPNNSNKNNQKLPIQPSKINNKLDYLKHKLVSPKSLKNIRKLIERQESISPKNDRNKRFFQTCHDNFGLEKQQTISYDSHPKTIHHARKYMGKRIFLEPIWPLLAQKDDSFPLSLSPVSRKLKCDPEGIFEKTKKRLKLQFAGGKKKAIIILPSISVQNSIKMLEQFKKKNEIKGSLDQ